MATYHDIFQFGNNIRLNKHINTGDTMTQLRAFDDDWNQYNEFKPHIQRQGLCLLNEDGINKPGPAISSLYEWNEINDTQYLETDFNISTPVYDACTDVRKILDEIKPHIYRTHFLNLKPGGYFTPHRDSYQTNHQTFRLLIPIANTSNPWCRFMIEDTPLYFEPGSMYVVNTILEHTLFNAGSHDSIWLVINAHVCDEMVNYVMDNMTIR